MCSGWVGGRVDECMGRWSGEFWIQAKGKFSEERFLKKRPEYRQRILRSVVWPAKTSIVGY